MFCSNTDLIATIIVVIFGGSILALNERKIWERQFKHLVIAFISVWQHCIIKRSNMIKPISSRSLPLLTDCGHCASFDRHIKPQLILACDILLALACDWSVLVPLLSLLFTWQCEPRLIRIIAPSSFDGPMCLPTVLKIYKCGRCGRCRLCATRLRCLCFISL